MRANNVPIDDMHILQCLMYLAFGKTAQISSLFRKNGQVRTIREVKLKRGLRIWAVECYLGKRL